MIPNVRGSVTDDANEKCVDAGRCLGPINRPWPVPGLNDNTGKVLQTDFKSS